MLTVRKTNSVLGAEILGVDLSRPIDGATAAEIDRLWLEHEVIFFRDQKLSPEDHIRFSEQLGPVEVHVRTDCCRPGYPKVFIVSNIFENGKPIGAGGFATSCWPNTPTTKWKPCFWPCRAAPACPGFLPCLSGHSDTGWCCIGLG